MGAWGTGIFQDDFACDLQQVYRELVALALDDAECLCELKKQFSVPNISETHDGATFWIALALSQHKLGRLQNDVKAEALSCIDSGEALRRWKELVDDDRSSTKKRGAVLQKAREKIISPSPKRKILKPSKELKKRIDCEFEYYPWQKGKIYGYLLPSGEYVLLACVAAREERYVGYYRTVGKSYVRADPPPLLMPFLLLLDYRGQQLPGPDEIANAEPLIPDCSEERRKELREHILHMKAFAKKLVDASFESFCSMVIKGVEPDAKEAELRERYQLRQKSAQLAMEKFADVDAAVTMCCFKLYIINPKLLVPREKLFDTGCSKTFLTEYRCYASDWEQLETSIARWKETERPIAEPGFGIDPAVF